MVSLINVKNTAKAHFAIRNKEHFCCAYEMIMKEWGSGQYARSRTVKKRYAEKRERLHLYHTLLARLGRVGRAFWIAQCQVGNALVIALNAQTFQPFLPFGLLELLTGAVNPA